MVSENNFLNKNPGNVLPVTAEDGFQIPQTAVLTELQRHPKVQAARDYNAAATYVKVLKAIFVQARRDPRFRV